VLGVERTHVDNGLGMSVAAEHDHQVGNHCSASFVVELHDLFVAQLIERQLNHSDSTLDDLRTRGDDCVRLLTNQNRTGKIPRLKSNTTSIPQPEPGTKVFSSLLAFMAISPIPFVVKVRISK
jgi:hypothetical protein